MKTRLAARGDGQDNTIYDKISSPTVSRGRALHYKGVIQVRKNATVDITGAFLECGLPPDDEVLMRHDPLVSLFLSELDPYLSLLLINPVPLSLG